MKKMLSILLVLAITASFAVCVSATEPPYAKTVIGIEAVWNGEIMLDPESAAPQPLFTPANVTITLHFTGEESEILDGWNDSGRTLYPYWIEKGENWSWWIFYDFLTETNTMTIYYEDINHLNAYLKEHPAPPQCSHDNLYDADICADCDAWWFYWAQYRAALPQSTFAFPADYLKQYIDNQRPLPQLKLNKTVTVKQQPTAGKPIVVAFTPKKSGMYYFYNGVKGLGSVTFLCGQASGGVGWGLDIPAGETCYFFLHDTPDLTYSLTVKSRLWFLFNYYLLGGWLWMYWLP
ncbi:MAG: hypothetical protein FWH26_03390 [Oscillospiraceae bacterium]|nr:hypothetical protein [Oscillospiraceae bacterium]